MSRSFSMAWIGLLLSLGLSACAEKVNTVTKDVHQYKDLNQELQKSQKYQPASDFKDQLGQELKSKIREFERHFEIEINYVTDGCLRRYVKEERLIKSFDYIMQNLKYPNFSKKKNVVLGCDAADLMGFRPGHYGQENEFNHIWVNEFFGYSSNDNLILDHSYDPYAEPLILSYIERNIATVRSDDVAKNLPFDSQLIALGCGAFAYKKIGTYDYDGLRQYLERNKGELFLEYEIPALLEKSGNLQDHVFSILTKDSHQIPYRIGSSSIAFDILKDPKQPAVLGNVLSKLNSVTCAQEIKDFRLNLENYKFNASGKIIEFTDQTIEADYDGKLKNKVETEALNPADHFSELTASVPPDHKFLPDENFDFDSIHRPGIPVRVGVLDSGLDYNHPALFFRLLREAGKIVGFDGYDFSNHLPFDHVSHGTHVAGIAMKGSQHLTLVPMRMNIFTEEDTFLQLIDSAVDAGVRVINVSLGWFSRSQGEEVFKGLIKGIRKHPEVIFVIAAGNESANLNVTPILPACLNADNTIVVAATDHRNEIADFSNYGRNCVDVAAPGVDINSALPGKDYLSSKKPRFGKMSGTSMAAPFVTNVVAKMLSLKSGLEAKQVKAILIETSFKTPGLKNSVRASGYVFPEAAYGKVKNEH